MSGFSTAIQVTHGYSRLCLHVVQHQPLFTKTHAQMDGLSSLGALEDLWLCRNRLTEIGDGLPLGRTLREVNIAHNQLGCFKELLKLAPLEGLRNLTLQDIHFGDNPVCGLSNYKTYVAYHLTQVRILWLARVGIGLRETATLDKADDRGHRSRFGYRWFAVYYAQLFQRCLHSVGASHPIWYVFLAPQTAAAGFRFSVNIDVLAPLFWKNLPAVDLVGYGGGLGGI